MGWYDAPAIACDWRVVAASVRGSSHEKTGQPCQDAHSWRVLSDGVLVAAVADGAGSAPLAEVGAITAARAAVEAICEAVGDACRPQTEDAWHALLIGALRAARAAVEAAAEQHGALPRDLATTLILTVATPTEVAAAQVGDGATVIGTDDGTLFALTAPECGEYINETTFLIAPEALEKAQVAIRKGRAAQLAVLSDGLQRLALNMPAGSPHAPFFAPLFRFAEATTDATGAAEQLTAFLRSPRLTARADDDLTLLLASRTR